MNKNLMKRMIRRMGRLSVLALVAGSAGRASAQTMGSNLATFNILGNQQVTLTGPNPTQPLIVDVVGTSPGIALTLTDASANHYHPNDAASINGQAEGLVLWNSLLAPAGANAPIALAANTLPPALLVDGGITIFTAAADITNINTATTITGTPTSVVIFQVTSSLSLTDTDVILAGGILPTNVYWRVTQAATVVNDDAQTRSFPGTVVNNTGAQDIAITVSGAGSLNIGRFASLQGKVSVTQSGPGVLSFTIPAGAGGGGPVLSGCTDGLFYPSPATGATGTFAYCMLSAGTVKIRVYNVIGDLAVKVDDTKSAGTQMSTIDTARLAPGVYLYLLERDYGSGNKSSSKVKKFTVRH